MVLGIILSLITVLVWSIDVVYVRYSLVHWGAHPVIFSCLGLFVAAMILILIAGPGKGGLETIKKPHTWVYGIFQILMNITEIFTFIYITSTESGLLMRLTIPLSLIAAWLFLNRKPSKFDWLGTLIVCAGVYYVASNIAPEVKFQSLFFVAMSALFSTARTMVAELHPSSAAATTVKERCRVTGHVLMVTSFVLILVFFVIAQVKTIIPAEGAQALSFLSNFPDKQAFFHHPTMITAIVFGIFIQPVAMYFFFYSAFVAKTEIFMAVASLFPLMTFAVEWTASRFGLLEIASVSAGDLIAGAVIVSGALLMLIMRHVKEAKET